ncbi:hypothetical protein F5148DRAFT_327403 [Russula earlei]|uniref:Uncharacterized protein n=1 Tax=Russula earlei TaxID=71964 RepID=A0ACC0UJU5_9AGAM|nr:hypothetical protein F5148DRAFT_327403 [Russula earlei]
MPLRLPPLNFAIICGGNELETYDVKQEGPCSMTAFVASEAGKHFKIMLNNHLLDSGLSIYLHIDGERVYQCHLGAGQSGQILGIYKDSTSVLPFKFQELELVDPDLENAPVIPEMGTIELRACRSRARATVEYLPSPIHGLHEGRVSERSKKAGWHHVSTADEVPIKGPMHTVIAEYIDPPNAPCASFKVFYRPRELLMAQGVITGHTLGNGMSEVDDRDRRREDGPSGPSKRRPGPTVKKEETDVGDRAQRIRALQAELDSLIAEQSSSSVKRERRSPSPIILGHAAGEVIDLTLED